MTDRSLEPGRIPTRDAAQMLTIQNVADRLRCSVDTVRRRIADGRLRALRDGGLIRISEADLTAYIKRSRCWL
jgi:excisionase family DNA binding protein